MEEEYILITWPESQEYMNYDWFRKEAYLLQAFEDQEHLDSAYFVPKGRYEEVQNEKTVKILTNPTNEEWEQC